MKCSFCEYRYKPTKACLCKEECRFQDMKYPEHDDEWRAYKICKRPNTSGITKQKKIDRCTNPEG